jgi:gamma-glutamylcyclotransferase (GGCT)/AIG2-like uncharacterized protein YtfP
METRGCNVFTYGSLMYPQVWQRVVRGTYQSSEASIRGFRRLCVRGETYPVLVVARGAPQLSGRVYYDVSPADIQRLDAFETEAYVRVPVAASTNGTAIAAQGYLGLHNRQLLGIDWSPEAFANGDIQSFLANYVPAHTSADDI